MVTARNELPPDPVSAMQPLLSADLDRLMVDHAPWRREVLAPASGDTVRIAALNDRVQAHRRVDNVLLTVRDGVLLVYKRPTE